MSAERILIVDDEQSIREFLSILLEEEGYVVETADSVQSALERLQVKAAPVVICDLKLPDGTGLDVLKHVRTHHISSRFIIITAHTTPQHALESLRAGAAEYLSKPFDVEELKLIVRKQMAAATAQMPRSGISEFIGESAPIREILDLVPRIAATPSTVLLTGESGTGKELLARAIHDLSPRSQAAFVTVNCGALPEGLLESELFGHVKGSFTGAVRDNPGLVAKASGGSIFLDEIGELSMPMQVKLLRVLAEHRVRPVGGTRERTVDVRVLAATNQDLEQAVAEGRFREDLFYRLNVIHLHLPPLRERQDDIPALARHFVEESCARLGVPVKRLTADAIAILQAYHWPGNVRELENVIERTVALEPSALLTSGSLPESLRGQFGGSSIHRAALPEDGLDLEEYLGSLRRALIQQALERTGGRQKQAADLLRMSYRSFRYYAQKLGLIHEEDTHS